MELQLNYYDQFQQLSSQQTFSDNCIEEWNLPLIPNARIYGETTIYMHDISKWRIPGNTLIIDTDRPPHTANQSTRKLIRDFLRSQPCRDIFVRMMTDHLGITHSRPIVFGTFRSVPLSGTTRGLSDWVFVHHLKDLYTDPEDDSFTMLNFDCNGRHLQLRVPFTETSISKKLMKATQISKFTYTLLDSFATIFGMSVIKPEDEVTFQIDHRLKNIEIPEMAIEEVLVDLLAHLFTISSEIVLDDPILSTSAAKKILMDPPSDLWRI
ncbi:hypothetical protein [Pediococcus stilesii]|uniref:Uncharacterized protein n=1 Tax=Pediococcus stilesii TaxID=331679 RepID=A0A0R2L329_9LACO|nr:hypothetical protein [Pediococcus stilesii]KRN93213.1 hypothetical protein IV81_GL000891 [Pediococcus stilesii]